MSAEDMGDYKEFPTKESALDWLDNYLSLDERNNLIRALQQDSTTKNDLGVDCVARQDVERFIEGFINEYTPEEELEFINLELNGLKHLPSVTPQEPQTFKWCTDCKEYDQEKHCCHRWSKVIRDTVEEMKQEPKTGHWIDGSNGWICSECNKDNTFDTNFCPNCGADMRESRAGVLYYKVLDAIRNYAKSKEERNGIHET